MSHRMLAPHRFNAQRGNLLLIALGIIIVLGALALTLTRLQSATSDTLLHDVYGLRALNAAQTGLEQAVLRAFPVSGAPSCQASTTLVFTTVAGLENCRSVLSCEIVSPAGRNLDYYRFKSTGVCEAIGVSASRTLAADAAVEN